MNLINVIKEIKNQIEKAEQNKILEIKKITEKYDKEITDLKTALEINMKLNTTCLECEGKGKIKVYDYDYENRGHMERCERCNGTGIEPKENEV